MAKKELTMRALVAPTDTVVVAAYDADGKVDACTLAFYMVSSHVPPCVTIAINATQKRKTLADILETGAFTVGFPGEDQLRQADYLGVASGHDTDKLANIGWTVTPARTVHAPVIDALRLTLECQVVHTVTVGSHTQITGEVKNILAEECILNDHNRVDLTKLKPLIYDEEETVYFGIGEKAGDAFRSGMELKRSLEES